MYRSPLGMLMRALDGRGWLAAVLPVVSGDVPMRGPFRP
jgi:hypothetical protein